MKEGQVEERDRAIFARTVSSIVLSILGKLQDRTTVKMSCKPPTAVMSLVTSLLG